jgi:hypothetical protein
MKLRWSLFLLCAVFALTVGVATANAEKGGNSANAKLCQKGGWENLYRSEDATSFGSEAECVSYGAQGGTLTTKTKAQLDCESVGGTFGADDRMNTEPPAGSTLAWTCNGGGVTREFFTAVLVPDCFSRDGSQSAVWTSFGNGTPGVLASSCYDRPV